tara:strand:+ start:151 stop:354 length:204 start_codon:yes stop_codon:yes gene_type:complete
MPGEHYTVSETMLSDPRVASHAFNVILQRIAERLDRIEGVNGTAVIREALEVSDANDNIIHSFGTST